MRDEEEGRFASPAKREDWATLKHALLRKGQNMATGGFFQYTISGHWRGGRHFGAGH